MKMLVSSPQTSFYPCLQTMPFKPTDLRLRPYLAPNSIKDIYEQEAAVRVVWPSIQQKQWGGVSLFEIIKSLTYEKMLLQENKDVSERNIAAIGQHTENLISFWKRTIATLGLYTLVVQMPTLALEKEPHKYKIFSCMPTQGPCPILLGLHRLLKVKLVCLGEQRDDYVLCPSEALVNILRKSA